MPALAPSSERWNDATAGGRTTRLLRRLVAGGLVDPNVGHLHRLVLRPDIDRGDIGAELRRLAALNGYRRHLRGPRLIDVDEAERHQHHDDDHDEAEQGKQRAHDGLPNLFAGVITSNR